MSEAATIARSTKPATAASLIADFRSIGVKSGSLLLVHSSLSSLGWVCGGAVAVIDALCAALGPRGTLVMPAHSRDLSDPSRWRNPPVPESWWATIREAMPPFEPGRTPTRGMGTIAECFRSMPGVSRSTHPTASFAALGPQTASILDSQALDDPFGEDSPLARLYELDASILLLGVGHDSNTSLHLAERRAFGGRQRRCETGAPLLRDGKREWLRFAEPEHENDDFPELGSAFESVSGAVSISPAGLACARLMRERPLIDFAVPWFRERRGQDSSPRKPD